LGTDFLEDIPFNAVALGVVKVDGKLRSDEEQRTEGDKEEYDVRVD
jgi:hypothetical protein